MRLLTGVLSSDDERTKCIQLSVFETALLWACHAAHMSCCTHGALQQQQQQACNGLMPCLASMTSHTSELPGGASLRLRSPEGFSSELQSPSSPELAEVRTCLSMVCVHDPWCVGRMVIQPHDPSHSLCRAKVGPPRIHTAGWSRLSGV